MTGIVVSSVVNHFSLYVLSPYFLLYFCNIHYKPNNGTNLFILLPECVLCIYVFCIQQSSNLKSSKKCGGRVKKRSKICGEIELFSSKNQIEFAFGVFFLDTVHVKRQSWQYFCSIVFFINDYRAYAFSVNHKTYLLTLLSIWFLQTTPNYTIILYGEESWANGTEYATPQDSRSTTQRW